MNSCQILRIGSREALVGNRVSVCEGLEEIPGGAGYPSADFLEVGVLVELVHDGGAEFIFDIG